MHHPVERYRCLSCEHTGLSLAAGRLYCPECGQVYPLLPSGAVDFINQPPEQLGLTLAQQVAHFPWFAWGYDRLWRSWALTLLTAEPFSSQREADLLNEMVGSATRILDLASASGYWSRLVLQRRPDLAVIGLDNSSAVLAEAAAQSQPTWSGYSLIRAQAERIPLGSGSIDAVICGAGLNELPLQPVLSEVSRILQPGGVFVSMHSRQLEGPVQWPQYALGVSGLRFYSESELTAALTTAQLTVKRYLTFGSVAFVQAVKG